MLTKEVFHLPYGIIYKYLYCLSLIIFIPFIIMFYLYQNNYREISFFPILITAGGIAVCAVVIFIAGTVLSRNASCCSLLTAELFTLSLFAYRPYCKIMYGFMKHGITVSYLALLAMAVFVLYWYRKEISMHLSLRKVMPIWFAFMFLAVIETAYVIPLAVQKPQNLISGKWEPVVENSLPQPNIYWIHCDGMLGFSIFEKYYGDGQNQFRNFLSDKGFIINYNAEFEAGHSTQYAVPVLMCPNLYDHCLSAYFSTSVSTMEFIKKQNVYAVSLSWFRLHDNELYMAFEKKGYDIHIVPDVPNYFLYNFRGKHLDADEIRDTYYLRSFYEEIFDRFAVFFLLFMKNSDRDRRIDKVFRNCVNEQDLGIECKFFSLAYNYDLLKELKRSFNKKSPKLVIINQDRSHAPFLFDENGLPHHGKGFISETDPAAYPAQHRFAAKLVCRLIIEILQNDPDAVIVIQGDHGLHVTEQKEFQYRFKKIFKQTEMWNSVISAVRIPEKFRTGNESAMLETPLNISRYLINHYVGSNNCQYLKKGEKNVH